MGKTARLHYINQFINHYVVFGVVNRKIGGKWEATRPACLPISRSSLITYDYDRYNITITARLHFHCLIGWLSGSSLLST